MFGLTELSSFITFHFISIDGTTEMVLRHIGLVNFSGLNWIYCMKYVLPDFVVFFSALTAHILLKKMLTTRIDSSQKFRDLEHPM